MRHSIESRLERDGDNIRVPLTVLRSPPADNLGVLSNEVLVVAGQTDRDDVLLENHVLGQTDQGHVVTEVRGVVAVVHLWKVRSQKRRQSLVTKIYVYTTISFFPVNVSRSRVGFIEHLGRCGFLKFVLKKSGLECTRNVRAHVR